jgi:hypothetical protein
MAHEWKAIAIITALGIALALIAFRISRPLRIREKIIRLRNRRARLENSLKSLQMRYYEGRSLPKSEYRIVLRKYRHNIAEIDRKLSSLEN